MEDFPSKVTTETGSPQSPSSQQGDNGFQDLSANTTVMMDMSFLRSIPAILMMTEIILGLLQWALIASAPRSLLLAYGWVMFVSVTLWILSTILFLLILFGAKQKLVTIPWPVLIMVYHGAAMVLYIVAFLSSAASVHLYRYNYFGPMAAAAFFCAAVMVSYSASTYFSYLGWKEAGGHDSTNTAQT